MTLTLPSHRALQIKMAINTALARKRASVRNWQKLLGLLCSTTPALYGVTHLFSLLQHALVQCHSRRIYITHLLRETLHEWLTLTAQVSDNPTPLHRVIPTPPRYVGATDASVKGMRGWWTTSTTQHTLQNTLWRAKFPPDVQDQLVTTLNPTGTINNSNLELTALIMGSILITSAPHMPHTNICLASDNTAAVTWINKGFTSTNGPPAFLLHSGLTNTIADCCSRLFHLNDVDFLQYMNATFPVQPSWTLAQPTNTASSHLNSALFRVLPRQVSTNIAKAQMPQHGTSGMNSATTCTAIHTCKTFKTPFRFCKYLLTATVWEKLLPVGLRYALGQWREPFVPWGRCLPHWAASTHTYKPRDGSTAAFLDSSVLTKNKIHHPQESSQLVGGRSLNQALSSFTSM
jgi:hypothetical protein